MQHSNTAVFQNILYVIVSWRRVVINIHQVYWLH